MRNIWDRLGRLFLESLVLFAVCLRGYRELIIVLSWSVDTSDNIANDVRDRQVFRLNEKCYGYKFYPIECHLAQSLYFQFGAGKAKLKLSYDIKRLLRALKKAATEQ